MMMNYFSNLNLILMFSTPRVRNDSGKTLPVVGSPYWMAPECINGEKYNEKVRTILKSDRQNPQNIACC